LLGRCIGRMSYREVSVIEINAARPPRRALSRDGKDGPVLARVRQQETRPANLINVG
jgi:hypothetical protein